MQLKDIYLGTNLKRMQRSYNLYNSQSYPGKSYSIYVDNILLKNKKADKEGHLTFNRNAVRRKK